MPINERIRELRKQKGITQAELAREIGMPGKNSTLRMWELGISNPPIPSIMKLADFFEVSLDYLIGRSDIEERRPVPVDELAIPVIAHEDHRHLIKEVKKMIDPEGSKTIFDPHETERTYVFPKGEKVVLKDICELIVRPSGTHRLKTGDGHSHIIPTGWIHIDLIIENWSV